MREFALNVHRIDKDVLRCDRNHPYFANENLDKLRNVIMRCVIVFSLLFSQFSSYLNLRDLT